MQGVKIRSAGPYYAAAFAVAALHISPEVDAAAVSPDPQISRPVPVSPSHLLSSDFVRSRDKTGVVPCLWYGWQAQACPFGA